jgi:hypothetical protein
LEELIEEFAIVTDRIKNTYNYYCIIKELILPQNEVIVLVFGDVSRDSLITKAYKITHTYTENKFAQKLSILWRHLHLRNETDLQSWVS